MDERLVRRIAVLSRIELRQGEAEHFIVELGDIVAYFDKLQELDTAKVKPLVHAISRHDVLAPDEPGRSLSADGALANAPRQDGTFFAVPRILGDGS